MSTNGHLKFQGTNRATFVGGTSNIMFDTTSTSLGIGVTGTDHPSSNLYITGNAYVTSDIGVGGVLTMGTVNVVARHDLESVTATGNTTPLTIEFSNATTGIVTTGNVEVGKELTVTGNATVSSNLIVSGNVEVGKELTVTGNATVSSNLIVSGNVEVGTANLFVDTVNSRVGVGIASPLSRLHVAGNGQTSAGGIIRAEMDDPGGTPYESNALTMKMGSYSHSIRMDLNTLRLNAYGDAGRYGAMQFVVGDGTGSGNGQVTAMTMGTGGNVGVGTSSPQTKFHVNNTVVIRNNANTAHGGTAMTYTFPVDGVYLVTFCYIGFYDANITRTYIINKTQYNGPYYYTLSGSSSYIQISTTQNSVTFTIVNLPSNYNDFALYVHFLGGDGY